MHIYIILIALFISPFNHVAADKNHDEPTPVEVIPLQDFEKLMNCLDKNGYDVSKFRNKSFVEKIYDHDSVFCGNKKLERNHRENGVIYAGCFNVKKGWVEKAIKYRDDTCLSMHEIVHEYGRQKFGDDWFGLEYGDHGHPIWRLINPETCGCKFK